MFGGASHDVWWYLLEQDLTTHVPYTRWNDMATSSTGDMGTSEVSEIENEIFFLCTKKFLSIILRIIG